MRTVPCLLLAAVVPILATVPVAAAPITWADPAGLCAGNAPCFTTLADAVANAGPAPAQVFVLPGTYAESLDLGDMGSALPSGAPGELAIVSVDAGGLPAPGATVDPGAPGGPGTGNAITATAFPAPLTLNGLVVRSPDLNGIFLTGGSENVSLLGVDASGSPMGNGAVVANSDGTVAVAGSTARLNLNAGFNLSSLAGQVSVTGSLAEDNDGTGVAIVSSSVTVTASQSDDNGQQGWLIGPPSAGGDLTLTNVQARGNGSDGLFGVSLSLVDQWTAVAVTNLTVQNNGRQGAALVGDTLTVSQLTTEDNLGQGLTLAGETLVVQQLTSARNGEAGALIFVTGQITIQNVLIDGNLDGGLGVVAGEGQTAAASANGLVATGNLGTGLAFVGLNDARFAALDIVNATATDNTEGGLVALADVATATQITATNNGLMGFTLEGIELAEASFVVATGQTLGISVGAAQEARLRDSDGSNNATGVLMGGDRVLAERVTATSNGPANGNPGIGAGFTFFNANTLDVRDCRAEANEFGWFFLELQTNGAVRTVDALQALGVRAPEGLSQSSPRLGQQAHAQQRIRIETSLTLANTQASMIALLRDGGIFQVSCSDFVGNGPSGLELMTPHTIDARANYWGATSGPTHPNNPSGTGDLVTDSLSSGDGLVLWSSFLPIPATPDDCRAFVSVTEEIPTLSPTGLAVLVLALIGVAFLLLRRGR